ncbi:MAG TPA: LapA family protein [Leptolyngbyaceae cyanobacterium]
MLRPLNFFLIFLTCLALVLFSLQNTEPVTIKLVNGIDIKAPLCIETIGTLGLGAFLAWLFSVWARFSRSVDAWKLNRELRQKNSKIQQLEKDLEQYKVETTEKKAELPPASEPLTEATSSNVS